MQALRLFLRGALALAGLTLLTACSTSQMARPPSPALSKSLAPSSARLLVRTGDIRVSLDDPAQFLGAVEQWISGAGGYVERSQADESSVWLTGRVPSRALESVMDQVAGLGKTVNRSVSASDVTDQHADLTARLETNRHLRARMRALLERASEVDDLLKIETQLARVQAEIESMEGALERLSGEIEKSRLTVRLDQRRVFGPIGWIGYWTQWSVSKLFVIR